MKREQEQLALGKQEKYGKENVKSENELDVLWMYNLLRKAYKYIPLNTTLWLVGAPDQSKLVQLSVVELNK